MHIRLKIIFNWKIYRIRSIEGKKLLSTEIEKKKLTLNRFIIIEIENVSNVIFNGTAFFSSFMECLRDVLRRTICLLDRLRHRHIDEKKHRVPFYEAPLHVDALLFVIKNEWSALFAWKHFNYVIGINHQWKIHFSEQSS